MLTYVLATAGFKHDIVHYNLQTLIYTSKFSQLDHHSKLSLNIMINNLTKRFIYEL